MEYHKPVLLTESIEGLKIKPSGIYVDATFGGGGHSKSILNGLDDKGHLFAFDQDEDAKRNVWDDDRLTFVQSNSRHLTRIMEYYDVSSVDGVLADLGVSSWQFDNPERGFSYREDHALDMRMNQQQEVTAANIVMTYSEDALVALLSDYGQVRNAKTLARRLVECRDAGDIRTIGDLLQAMEPCIWGNRVRYLSQVFQALRIEVNDEIGALHDLMESSIELLSPGGRLVVISYHSVEDQVVKRWMKAGNREGVVVTDDTGHRKIPLKMLTKKPTVPTDEEIELNNRARSAKLRIAVKK